MAESCAQIEQASLNEDSTAPTAHSLGNDHCNEACIESYSLKMFKFTGYIGPSLLLSLEITHSAGFVEHGLGNIQPATN